MTDCMRNFQSIKFRFTPKNCQFFFSIANRKASVLKKKHIALAVNTATEMRVSCVFFKPRLTSKAMWFQHLARVRTCLAQELIHMARMWRTASLSRAPGPGSKSTHNGTALMFHMVRASCTHHCPGSFACHVELVHISRL